MLVASKGVLVKCDPSIKALIIQIDSVNPGIVLEELDDTHLLIQQDKVETIKNELNKMLSKNTGQLLSKIEKDVDRDFYMSAEESKKYGIVDKIIIWQKGIDRF